ncbi:MAG: PH domain-containing protein [Bacteroidia bacterium]|nr:PH domain-containing protein [Bacteroidia bacterium]
MDHEFSNTQMSLNDLPKIGDIEFVPLEKDYLLVIILSKMVSQIITAIFLIVFLTLMPFDLTITILKLVGVTFVLYLLWSYISAFYGFRHKQFALREKDIIYKTGWIWRSMTVAPFNRVQHVRIDQGPIERQFNLSRLKIFTAGGSSSDLTIPGLNPGMAESLKEYIVEQTKQDEEE